MLSTSGFNRQLILTERPRRFAETTGVAGRPADLLLLSRLTEHLFIGDVIQCSLIRVRSSSATPGGIAQGSSTVSR